MERQDGPADDGHLWESERQEERSISLFVLM